LTSEAFHKRTAAAKEFESVMHVVSKREAKTDHNICAEGQQQVRASRQKRDVYDRQGNETYIALVGENTPDALMADGCVKPLTNLIRRTKTKNGSYKKKARGQKSHG